MGLSLHNTVAVLQGWLGKKSAFIRTPKFGIQHLKDTFKSRNYLASKISWTTFMEGALMVYFLGASWLGWHMQNFTFLLLHVLMALGYGTIFFYTLRHLRFR
jgi:hypothetical protein